jgi:hypothetical protein
MRRTVHLYLVEEKAIKAQFAVTDASISGAQTQSDDTLTLLFPMNDGCNCFLCQHIVQRGSLYSLVPPISSVNVQHSIIFALPSEVTLCDGQHRETVNWLRLVPSSSRQGTVNILTSLQLLLHTRALRI